MYVHINKRERSVLLSFLLTYFPTLLSLPAWLMAWLYFYTDTDTRLTIKICHFLFMWQGNTPKESSSSCITDCRLFRLLTFTAHLILRQVWLISCPIYRCFPVYTDIYLFAVCLFFFFFIIYFCWSRSYRLAALCCSSERWVGGAWAFYDPSSSSFHPVKCLTTINLNSPP